MEKAGKFIEDEELREQIKTCESALPPPGRYNQET